MHKSPCHAHHESYWVKSDNGKKDIVFSFITCVRSIKLNFIGGSRPHRSCHAGDLKDVNSVNGLKKIFCFVGITWYQEQQK